VRLVLDACVLYPPVLRAILFGTAAGGLFVPLWSDRILEEWARATVKLGPDAEALARADAILARAAFPRAGVAAQRGIEARLILPDENDIHVLATAIAGHADAILTFNAQDFPRHVLAAEGIERRDPDGFLWDLWSHHPDAVVAVIARTHAEAERRAGQTLSLRALLKRTQLPRLGRALQGQEG
jgi:predicted nucleic acid-binding protein